MVKCYRKTVALSNFWVTSNDKLSDFYASSLQRGESPVPLLVIRVLTTAVALGILTWSLYEGKNALPYWLLYLTNWGLILVTAMLLSGLIVSCMAVTKKMPVSESSDLPWYVGMYWFLYNMAVTIAFMISALYWILLHDPESAKMLPRRLFWLVVSNHAFNSCLALVEVLVSRTPVRLAHMYQPLGAGLWYAAFSAIYYAAGGLDANGFPYIYEILNWQQWRRSSIVVAASAAGLLVVYVALWCVALARDKLSTALLRTTSVSLSASPPDRLMGDFP